MPRWLRRPGPLFWDVALALGLLLLSLVTAEPASARGEGGPSSWIYPLVLLATLPVAGRRRYPIPVLVVTLGAALAMHFAYGNFQFAGALVALYTVAAHVGRPTSLRVAAGTAVVLLLVNVASRFDDWGSRLLFGVAVYAMFAAAWLLGDNLRTRRAYLREVEDRAERLEREREADARRAAGEEQARIARELHDIITHNVSVMTVQAAAAGDVFETQPGRAREALDSIESSGREALTELRRLLGAVRTDDAPSELTPQPGLSRLDDLVEQVRAAGLDVELSIEGDPRELPVGVDLSAYRIVQEALTNVLRHASASNAVVTVRYRDDSLVLVIVDDGRGPAPDRSEGRGLIGMRERAVLVGGELQVGPGPDGGFAVKARIPLKPDAE
jgi:signal transduction histidine kinase